ncbi:MAG: bifunctional YncE family protein/alkaline phosphatase family protein [Candidatus Kryptoniota bacterium]
MTKRNRRSRARHWSLILLLAICYQVMGTGAARAQDKDDMEFDEPGSEQALNRQLWEFAKGTSYESVEAYVAKAQAKSRAMINRMEKQNVVSLPTGWNIHPAGTQIQVGHLPYEALMYNGKLIVLNTGYYSGYSAITMEDTIAQQEISIVDPDNGEVEDTLKFDCIFPSAAAGMDGNLYVSGGFDSTVHRIDKQFKPAQEYKLGGYTSGLAPVDSQHIAVLYLVTTDTTRTRRDLFGTGHYVKGRIALLNIVNGQVEREAVVGYFPYSVEFVNGKFYVSLLGENEVNIYDSQFRELKSLKVGTAPANMTLDGHYIYIVNTTSDEISVIDTKTDKIARRIFVGRKEYNSGISPTSCAITNGKLYVSEATLNAVAVYRLVNGKLLGYIPTGWYATKVFLSGQKLIYLSAKGISPRRPNPNGPSPIIEDHKGEYVLNLLTGAVGIVPIDSIENNLHAWTDEVENGSPLYSPGNGLKVPIKHIFYIIKENRSYDQMLGDLGRGNGDSSLTIFGRNISPNIHKLATDFVTLDNFYADGEISVLGHSFTTSGYASPFLEWLGNASYSGRYNGYPFGTVPAVFSKTYIWDALEAKHLDYKIYGEPYYLMTAAYKVIERFFGANSIIAQKFYANSMALAGEVDRGVEFSEFVQTFYGRANNRKEAFKLLGDGVFTKGISKIFTGDETLFNAIENNVRFKKAFADFLYHYSFNYWTWDLWYSDIRRFESWKTDFDQQLKSGNVVPFEYIWLPNDHTGGTNISYQNPYQLVAQNDIALGMIVQTIAESPVWKNSLIFVEEDDAQNGPDHVDATRTEALAAGPFVKRGMLVSDRYDQLSMLHTIELILGLGPLNFGDGMATPMFGVFSSKPDFARYTALPPSDSLSKSDRFILEKITAHAKGKK